MVESVWGKRLLGSNPINSEMRLMALEGVLGGA